MYDQVVKCQRAGLCLSEHFLIVTLWPISTLCVADMVHAVADMVCGRYRRFPSRLPLGIAFVYSKACRRIWVKPRPCQINRIDHPKTFIKRNLTQHNDQFSIAFVTVTYDLFDTKSQSTLSCVQITSCIKSGGSWSLLHSLLTSRAEIQKDAAVEATDCRIQQTLRDARKFLLFIVEQRQKSKAPKVVIG